MHILFLPSFYPEMHKPVNGLFFRNQSKVLIGKLDKIGTVYIEQKSLRKFFVNICSNLFQKSIEDDEGIHTYRVHGLNLLNQYNLGTKLWMYLTQKLIDRYIKENGKPDLIHAHNVFNGGRAALDCFNRLNIPYIITEHASGFLLDEYSSSQLNIAKEVFKHSRHIVAVSENLATAIELSCNISNVKVVPNVVDTGVFKLDESVKKYDSFTFISVGNLLQNKGHHILIEAFKGFSEKFPKSQLFIFGEGLEYKNLSKLISNLDLDDKVFLKGRVMPIDLVKEYQKSHCLILPSYKETFGVVLIEAMSCGLPVIATKSGGPDDLVNEQNGLLVEPGSVILMTSKMLDLYENYDKFHKKDIHNFVNHNFGKDIIAKKLLDIYFN